MLCSLSQRPKIPVGCVVNREAILQGPCSEHTTLQGFGRKTSQALERYTIKKKKDWPGIVAQAFNSSSQEAEAG